MSSTQPILVLALVGSSLGCVTQRTEVSVGAESAALIYGTDDRSEWYDVDDRQLRRLATEVSVALIDRTLLDVTADHNVTLPEDTYAELYDLCTEERFADQPSAARCSGVLVDRDLVLTAAHCLQALPCEEWSFVFGYQFDAPAELHTVRDSDVFGCKALSAYGYDRERHLDYALISLDRAVPEDHRPARIEREIEPLDLGDPVVVIGNSAGLPTKIDRGGSVIDAGGPGAAYFVTDSDNFQGGSGSGVYDARGRLRGIVARGGADYLRSETGCQRERVATADERAAEQVTYAAHAIEHACKSDHAQLALCGTAPQQAATCALGTRSSASRAVPAWAFALMAVFAARHFRLQAKRSKTWARASSRFLAAR